jgi:D-sedoheptulose 7-phosphate isomerase
MGKRIDRIASVVDEHLAVAQRTRAELLPVVEEFAAALCEALGAGHKLVAFGNGGSAADAQHFAAELTGHFAAERGPLPAVALTVDTSALTAIANDYGYADVFARQAMALCRPGDVVVAISTSGSAESVTRGVEAARARGAVTWGFTGGSGGRLREIADHSIVVPSSETARIQEMHITIIHAVCAVIDDWVAESGGPRRGMEAP